MTDLYWRRIVKGFENPPTPGAPGSILFICQGNVCRSPFAEAYLRKIAGERNLAGIRSLSAGIDVRVSVSSPDPAIRVATTLGVDLLHHRSKPVSIDMVEESDVIFAMEHRQATYLRSVFPGHIGKIFLLPLFDPDPSPPGDHSLRYNIPDPYGRAETDFLECFRKIERSTGEFLSRTDLFPTR
jgi:protein-tyrosine phosphatase